VSLLAAAVCPHPPLLVPQVGAGEPVAARDPAAAAVRRLAATRPDVIVVIGADASGADASAVGTRHYPGSAVGDFAGFGVPLRVALEPARAAGDPVLPLSLSVGAWLLAAAGWSGAARGVGVPARTAPAVAAAIGADLVRAAEGADERLALLVMGDGSARRSLRAPGGLDERGDPFDADVIRALRAADPEALLALDPVLATDLLVAGLVPWQVLAGALLAAAPDNTARRSWQGSILYADAPYGVGYLVAVWERGIPA
jgi:hypothetical protein